MPSDDKNEEHREPQILLRACWPSGLWRAMWHSVWKVSTGTHKPASVLPKIYLEVGIDRHLQDREGGREQTHSRPLKIFIALIFMEEVWLGTYIYKMQWTHIHRRHGDKKIPTLNRTEWLPWLLVKWFGRKQRRIH